ncbi:hypothetical protein [Paenibacillus flagellatus]|uniref:Beta-hexosaminidase bacterial type N-terminal domain-containing protein n=1 Tax=Paenibacillus flagellatus TaxID=2211139 RepID=A0A2V5KAN6_9BACL|nr:hypothetical protein [Paenibacillus flagellatus]PYI50880.1 hypothetical protein DLM86_27830 [Paenibacillus flagellatus]
MMHNSLLIRDLLKSANGNPLHRGRRDPHRLYKAGVEAVELEEGRIALRGSWSVSLAPGSKPGWAEAADDLRDGLSKLSVRIDATASNTVTLSVDEALPDGAFRRTARPHAVTIGAKDARGLWAGVVYTEREIAVRGSAVIDAGDIVKTPSWPVQISQAPFGSNYLVPDLSADYLSDDAFRMLAHFGANGMTIYGDWLLYVRNEKYPELSSPDYERNIATLRDAVDRAGKYGVKLYYVAVSPKFAEDHPLFVRRPGLKGARIAPGQSGTKIHNLCSSDAEALELHGETMASLFREVPELGGLILIIGGESYYHCFMRPDKTGLPAGTKTNCPRCAARKPEDVVGDLLRVTGEAVRAANPDVPVLAWPYSAFAWSGDPAQLELLRGMAPEVGLLTTIEKDQWYKKDGYSKQIWDYSVDYTGPADNTLRQAEVTRERGLRLFIKHETALGLEFIQFPYVPALQRLGEKWANVSGLRPDGVLQSWMFFGMWGSRAEELGWWTSWRPDVPQAEAIERMARRDFGAAAPVLIEAWRAMSEAVSRLPCIPTYFKGPEFIGPAHPLLFEPDEPVPELFHCYLYYLQELEETFSTTVSEVKHSLVLEKLPVAYWSSIVRPDEGRELVPLMLDEYEAAAACAARSYALVRDLPEPDDDAGRIALAEEKLLIEAVSRTMATMRHSYRFLRAKAEYADRGDPEAMRDMVAAASAELDNARAARAVWEKAPWLNIGLRVDGKYPDNLEMLDAKIAMLERGLAVRAEIAAGASPASEEQGGRYGD